MSAKGDWSMRHVVDMAWMGFAMDVRRLAARVAVVIDAPWSPLLQGPRLRRRSMARPTRPGRRSCPRNPLCLLSTGAGGLSSGSMA